MKDNALLSGKRLWILLKSDIVVSLRTGVIVVAAVFGMLLVINVASVAPWDKWSIHDVFFPLTLLIGGHVFTSLAFRDMFHRQKSYAYLALPASQCEKYILKLAFTTVGYAVVTATLYYLFSVLAAGLTTLFFGVAHSVFQPFSPLVWQIIPLFLVTQSITFFGAVYFKKLHFVKTMLAITLFTIIVGILISLLVRLVFWEYFTGFFSPKFGSVSMNFDITYSDDYPRFKNFVDGLLLLAKILLYAIIPTFFWITGYIRFRETEVQNGF